MSLCGPTWAAAAGDTGTPPVTRCVRVPDSPPAAIRALGRASMSRTRPSSVRRLCAAVRAGCGRAHTGAIPARRRVPQHRQPSELPGRVHRHAHRRDHHRPQDPARRATGTCPSFDIGTFDLGPGSFVRVNDPAAVPSRSTACGSRWSRPPAACRSSMRGPTSPSSFRNRCRSLRFGQRRRPARSPSVHPGPKSAAPARSAFSTQPHPAPLRASR